MFTVDGVKKFHHWTHQSLALVTDHLATMPSADYTKTVPGFGWATLRDQLLHITNCEGFWVHILQGASYSDVTAEQYPALADAVRYRQQVARDTEAYFSGLTEDSLNTRAELRFPDGDVANQTPALIIHHFLTHAFHHKGQVLAMCRILGHPAPDTDLNNLES